MITANSRNVVARYSSKIECQKKKIFESADTKYTQQYGRGVKIIGQVPLLADLPKIIKLFKLLVNKRTSPVVIGYEL